MTNIKSEKSIIRLRPYKECDAQYIVKWIKDEYAFHQWSANRLKKFPLAPEDLNNYYREFQNSNSFWQMTAFDGNKIPIGHFTMRFIDDEMKIVRLGFIILDDKMRGKGYGKKMIELGLKYSFDILKVDKVTLDVFTNNKSAYNCYNSVGFKEVRTDSNSFKLGNEFWPCTEMEISIEDFSK